MTEFLDWLNNAPHKGCPNEYLHGLLRNCQTEELDADLNLAFTTLNSDLTKACAAHDSESVNVSGWRELFIDWYQFEKNHGDVYAISIHISGHYEGAEPRIETSFHTDEPYESSKIDTSDEPDQYAKYQFSTTDLSDIHEECRKYPPAWLGGGDGQSGSLILKGFSDILGARDPVNQSLNDEDNALPNEEYFRSHTDVGLCNWYIYLHFFKTVRQTLNSIGLPRKVPVILGHHDFGPWVGLAFENTEIQTEIIDAKAVIDEREQAVEDKKDAYIQEQIERYYEWYNFSRKVSAFSSRNHKELRAHYVKTFHFEFAMRKIQIAKPLHKIRESDFDNIMQAYINKRLERRRAQTRQ